ncbi:MAG: hypothetical protein ACLPOO_10030 [Terriglobales bacterium]
MSLFTIVLTIAWLLASGAPHASGVAFPQTAPSPQTSQPDKTPASPAPTPPPPTAVKPCPAVPPSGSAPQTDCAATAKTKKHKKKVVHNGSTGDPDVKIAPGVSQQQASQQLETTNHLLAMTGDNLKTIASRQLNPAQQDTVKQIRSYMEQSKKAADDGDVQRAYTLANKARMLSGDLVKH